MKWCRRVNLYLHPQQRIDNCRYTLLWPWLVGTLKCALTRMEKVELHLKGFNRFFLNIFLMSFFTKQHRRQKTTTPSFKRKKTSTFGTTSRSVVCTQSSLCMVQFLLNLPQSSGWGKCPRWKQNKLLSQKQASIHEINNFFKTASVIIWSLIGAQDWGSSPSEWNHSVFCIFAYLRLPS